MDKQKVVYLHNEILYSLVENLELVHFWVGI